MFLRGKLHTFAVHKSWHCTMMGSTLTACGSVYRYIESQFYQHSTAPGIPGTFKRPCFASFFRRRRRRFGTNGSTLRCFPSVHGTYIFVSLGRIHAFERQLLAGVQCFLDFVNNFDNLFCVFCSCSLPLPFDEPDDVRPFWLMLRMSSRRTSFSGELL